MGITIQENISKISKALSESPLSISEISNKADINWRTAQQYLELMEKSGLVAKKGIKNTKTYFLKEKSNYFDLPIKGKHKQLIQSIYAEIKSSCLKLFDKEPTKTQVYKIIWKVDKTLGLNLPIGWYRFGPCCVQVYSGNEHLGILSPKIVSAIKESVKEYCPLSNTDLQRKVYDEAKNAFYIAKEELMKSSTKDAAGFALLKMIKECPSEADDVITDFASTVSMIGKEETMPIFELVWKYVTMVIFRDTLRYYPDVGVYFDKKIEDAKKDAQLEIFNAVRTHVEVKYAQDERYQSWKKKRQNA